MPSGADRRHRKELNKVKEMSGEEFDRAYIQLMTKDHPKGISFRAAIEKRSRCGLESFCGGYTSKN
jgi:hypothetical protein